MMSAQKADITILIADGQALFRAALRQLLKREPGFNVVGEASCGKEALEMMIKLQPDVGLLDLNLPQQSGLETLSRLQGTSVRSRILLLAESMEGHQILEALRLGSRGIVFKSMSRQLLYKSIRMVVDGGYWVGRGVVSDLVNSLRAVEDPDRVPAKSSNYGLTHREFEILTTVVDGYTNKDIAEKFAISEQTVKHHLTNIFEKVGVSNRLELALRAVEQRLIYEV
jgi:two-component system, NarL family, nitrate/nitrite response regulator NarL